MHIGQTEIATLEAVRQLFVIEAQLMQQRRVEVMDVDFVLHGIET